jgi:23S rRNA (pseudouridine1915-N3)-methyltransferase
VKLAFVFVGGGKEAWLEELTSEYLAKLKPFVSVELIRLKPSKQARESAAKKLAVETAELMRVLKKDDLVVLCDERGDAVSSRKFSAKLVSLFERGRPRVVIVIGGAFGFSDDIRKRADWTWSLSTMVFNHHIAQAVVLEQVYRAFAIWRNLPYHND